MMITDMLIKAIIKRIQARATGPLSLSSRAARSSAQALLSVSLALRLADCNICISVMTVRV
jgi:hypothetical protein